MKRREIQPSPSTRCERGQALAEVALFSILAIILAFGMLTLIPIHRARTTATAAAYACAQFLSQSPNPHRAATNARQIAMQTINSRWSATKGVRYSVQVEPGVSGSAGACAVHYRVPLIFGSTFGIKSPGWSSVRFVSRSETWKAKWP